MTIGHAIMSMLSRNVGKISSINRRYATPRLEVTPAVRWTLVVLRVYLVLLIGLLAFKFYTVL